MTCKNHASIPNNEISSNGGTPVPKSNNNAGAKGIQNPKWEKEEYGNGSFRYKFTLNGRRSSIWVDRDKYAVNSRLPYGVYSSGRAGGCALSIGHCKTLLEAKNLAIKEQIKINNAEESRLSLIPAVAKEKLSDSDFNLLRNLLGTIDDDVRDRMKGYLDDPSSEKWDDVAHIIIRRSPMMTVWQAVIKTTPGFPLRGPRYIEGDDKPISGWDSIPTKKEFVNAVLYAAYTAEEQEMNRSYHSY